MTAKTFEYGILTDQIDQDLEKALPVAVEHGLTHVSLHNLWDKRVTDLTDAELQRARDLIKDHGLRVNMICGLLFRPFHLSEVEAASMEHLPLFERHMELLDRAIAIAHAVEAPAVRAFGFSRSMAVINPSPRWPDGGGIADETLEKIAKGLRIACERVEQEGLILALENCRAFFANTGGNLRRILDAVDHPRLKVIWDPSNAFRSGETPYPDGFDAVRGYIVDVHCKDDELLDADTGLIGPTVMGRGGAMWPEQIAGLLSEPVNTLTLETSIDNFPRLQAIVEQVIAEQTRTEN